MDYERLVHNLWQDIDNQAWHKLSKYFAPNAVINWPNTEECFTVDEFVLINSKYPGSWQITIEKLFAIEETVISVTKHVSLKDDDISYHAVSFFQFADGKIEKLDEYWGTDDEPPQWRIDMRLGNYLSSNDTNGYE
jgi:hypothetical protein